MNAFFRRTLAVAVVIGTLLLSTAAIAQTAEPPFDPALIWRNCVAEMSTGQANEGLRSVGIAPQAFCRCYVEMVAADETRSTDPENSSKRAGMFCLGRLGRL